MKLGKLEKGNCHIYSYMFKMNNFEHSKWVFKIIKRRGFYILSSHIIYKDTYRITYRSLRGKNKSGNFFWFKGRPQVVKLNKLKK